MACKIIDCVQGSDEWLMARMGMATASEFGTVMASGRDGGDSKTRKTYLYKLAGEIITGLPMDNYSNAYMDKGKEDEPEARNLYALIHDVEVEQIGFAVNGLAGASPDGVIGKNGMTEIKRKLAHIQVEVLLKDQLPPEHRPQTQGGLWVLEREWIDFVSYSPKMPLFVKRCYRDEPYIQQIEQAVRKFNDELQEIVARLRKYGPEALAA